MSQWGKSRVFIEDGVGLEVIPLVKSRAWEGAMPDGIIENVVIIHEFPEQALPPFGTKVECKEANLYVGKPYREWLAGIAGDTAKAMRSEVDMRTLAQEALATLSPSPILWYGEDVPVKDSRQEQLRRVACGLFEMAAAMDRGELEYSSGGISISTTPSVVCVVSDLSFQRK